MSSSVPTKDVAMDPRMIEATEITERVIARPPKSKLGTFFKAILRSPRNIGAIYPSSKRLSRAMAQQVLTQPNSLVVELGAGTGVITQALLEAKIDPQNLVVIERDPSLAKLLLARFPKVNIVEGDAAHLDQIIAPYQKPVSTIVSGLPFLSLPKPAVKSIGMQLTKLLAANGRVVQFTYRVSTKRLPFPLAFERVYRKKIWLNFPPARVEVYDKSS